MIQANKLKEGNYVKAGKITIKITDIQERVILGIEYPEMNPNYLGKKLEYKISIRNEDISDFMPISLTEDILLRNPEVCKINPSAFVNAGELPPEETIYFIDSIKLTRIRHNAWKAEYLVDNIVNDPIVLYVHELQNLYSSVTGKELEIQL